MKDNPLIASVEAYAAWVNTLARIGQDLIGDTEPNDEFISQVSDLVITSYDAISDLSPRAEQARLNAIWKDFKEKHAAAKT